MPGEYVTPRSMNEVERVIQMMTVEDVEEDSMSPLTTQHTEHELSRFTAEPELVLRIEYPLEQIYIDEGVPSTLGPFEDEVAMDPRVAVATVNEFLEEVQHQWNVYGHGPRGFSNHWVNPECHQVSKIECIMAALMKESDNASTNRAGSLGAEAPIKQEDEGENPPRHDERDNEGHHCEGLAPSMLNHPAYLSGWDLDIISHLYGSR